jgi:hypothetical protein
MKRNDFMRRTREKAMCASMGLEMLTGISFSTSLVVDVKKFDSLISKVEKI